MGLSEGLLRLGGDGISTTSVPSPSCNKKIAVCYYIKLTNIIKEPVSITRYKF